MSDRDELIVKARKVSAAATEGPWESCAVEHEITTREDGDLLLRAGFSAQATDADLLFIAESRTLLPALADLAESEGRRADEAEAARQRWKPIETAPKDGTSILGWCGAIRDGGYGIQHLYWDIRWQLVGGDLEHDYEPTLWLPTPAAPKEQP